jgi:hypothetical protein
VGGFLAKPYDDEQLAASVEAVAVTVR